MRLFWKLYLTYLLTVALCAVAVGWFAISSAGTLYHNQAEQDLLSRAQLIEQQIGGLIGIVKLDQLQTDVHNLGWSSGTRITVIAGPGLSGYVEGKVLADSEVPASTLENHAGRPEVATALLGGVGKAIRNSATLKEDMLYVALPVSGSDGTVIGVIRTALPLTMVNHSLNSLLRRIVLAAVILAVLVAAVGLIVSRRIARHMNDIKRGAERFAAGDFSHEVHVSSSDDIGSVAASLNRMGRQLDDTIKAITQQRNEREAILSGMVEGVVAVDDAERLITINRAAAALLGVTQDQAEGRAIQQVVRNPELQQFVVAALAADTPIEGDLTFHVGADSRSIQAHGSRLIGADGAGLGAVVVLNDITRLRRFETVRRDFVANVSHEIKTPVTSIKGFAETLLDGALDDRADAERFLRIIAGQADRLSAIVEDLLALSVLEREPGSDGGIVMERGSVCDVLQVAAEVCQPKAEARSITLVPSCPAEVFLDINPPLLEQAVVNLIDNAIKYSPEGSSVEIGAEQDGDTVVISVIDHGIGIAREHLPRLFERFYRVDKARSRDMGGTGLGLAIVKHVAASHGGSVAVESTLGVGSTFRIVLPA